MKLIRAIEEKTKPVFANPFISSFTIPIPPHYIPTPIKISDVSTSNILNTGTGIAK